MKILHLNTEMGFRGGERQVQLLIEGLRLRGVAGITLGPAGSPLLAALEKDGFPTACYGQPGIFGMRGPILARLARDLAAREQVDLVHAHTAHAQTLAVSAFSGRLPIVVTRRVDFPIKANFFSRRKYLAAGQHYIAISNGVRDVLERGGVPAANISLVHSGVELKRVLGGTRDRLRPEWLGTDEGPLIGFVGALVDHKAPWILAEAAPLIRRELPGARVVLVGEGDERPRLEALARTHAPAIHLAGFRPDVADCYAAFDLFVMPSKLEGLCTSLIDALAAGVPSVASRTGGIPDVIEHGRTGILVPPENAPQLAAAVVSLWKDPARRASFSVEGRRHVEEQFTAEAMVEGTMRVYERVLARGRR